MRREDWSPSSHSRVCSDNLQEKFINRTGLIAGRLWEDAVPTRFKKFPQYLKQVKSLKNTTNFIISLVYNLQIIVPLNIL